MQYFRFDELMTALKIDAGLPPARLKRRKYMSTALLLIDELGFEPMTRQEASLFFRLVTYRYGRGAILITTNKSVRDWTELLAGDEVLGRRDPGSAAAPGSRPEHQGPKLSSSRSRRRSQAVPRLITTQALRHPGARRLLRSARPDQPSAVPS